MVLRQYYIRRLDSLEGWRTYVLEQPSFYGEWLNNMVNFSHADDKQLNNETSILLIHVYMSPPTPVAIKNESSLSWNEFDLFSEVATHLM